eukprot:5100282-Pyramimonas_sp.AAC.1
MKRGRIRMRRARRMKMMMRRRRGGSMRRRRRGSSWPQRRPRTCAAALGFLGALFGAPIGALLELSWGLLGVPLGAFGGVLGPA